MKTMPNFKPEALRIPHFTLVEQKHRNITSGTLKRAPKINIKIQTFLLKCNIVN